MASEVKSLNQGIKDLRRSLEDGGLAWAHATESAGKYLQTILPGVCSFSMQKRGDWRHTSGGDKYDLKKVITTRFKSGRGTTIATCHAHGDGTWNLLFSPAGKAHLSKMGIFSAVEDALEVTVLQRIDDEGRVFHYGEMIKKPDVCRRPVSENNDERHRLKQLELKEMDRKGFTQLFPRTIRLVEESIDEDANDEVFEARNASTISTGRKGSQHLWKSHYRKDGNILTPEQEQLAVDLSKENMSSKEQRCLFQRIKTMPSDQQQLTLERSKALKTAAEHDR